MIFMDRTVVWEDQLLTIDFDIIILSFLVDAGPLSPHLARIFVNYAGSFLTFFDFVPRLLLVQGKGKLASF